MTKWQLIGKEIDAAFIFAGSDFVQVLRASHRDVPYHFVVAVWRAKKSESTRMNPRNTIIAILAALSVSLALAEDFKTINGKEYKNAKVSRVEPDGIVLITKSGISKVYFTELPKEVQQRFNYDSEKAAAFSANQNAALEQARKQQEQATQSPTQLSEDDKIKAIMNSTQVQRAEIGEEQMALIRNSDHYKRGYAKQSTEVKITIAEAERTFRDAESALHRELPKPRSADHLFQVIGADAMARDRLLDLYAVIMKDGE